MVTLLSFSGVSKWLGDKLVLDDINWRVSRGEHWVILGLNGSGKTTLLRIASGHLWPTSGEVTLLGKRFGTVDLRVLRRNVGWVTSALTARIPPKMTSLEVVVSGRFDSFGLYEEPSADDMENVAGLLDYMDAMELSTREFGVLSQGEQQRILLARGLIADPKILILDEPCGGLDMKSREHFLRYVGKLTERIPSIIYVTHHIEEIIPEFTHIMLMKDGRTHKSGPTPEVLTSRNLSRAYGVKVKVRHKNGRYYASA